MAIALVFCMKTTSIHKGIFALAGLVCAQLGFRAAVPEASGAAATVLQPIDGEAALASFWADQAAWIYETGYQGGETFQAVQDAYVEGDGHEYARLQRQELTVLQHLVPEECVVRQAELREYIEQSGSDGLEGLYLSYHDCAASSDNPKVVAAAEFNTEALQSVLWSAKEPKPNLHPRVSLYNSNDELAVTADAARTLLTHIADDDPWVASGLRLEELLAVPTVEDALCNLSPRLRPDGGLAPVSLLTLASCEAVGRPGGVGALAEVCEQLHSTGAEPQEWGGAFGGDVEAPALAESLLSAGASSEDVSWLFDYCDNRSSGGILPGSPGLLDGSTMDECLPSKAGQLAASADLAEKVQDCMGDTVFGDGGNPLAAGPYGRDPKTGEWRGSYMNPNGSPKITRGWYKNPPEAALKYAAEALIRAAVEINHSLEYSRRAREAGCYELATKCETGDDGWPVCVENCPGASGTDTDSTTTTTTTPTESESASATASATAGATATDTDSTTTSTTGAADPGDMGGFDPMKPSCEELMGLGVITPEGVLRGDNFWSEVFDRKPGEDPRKSYPAPDSMDDVDDGECNSVGATNYSPTGGKCSMPISCPMGTTVGDDCTCDVDYGGAMLPGLSECFNVMCPPDSTPTPVGGFDCMCSDGNEGIDPGPLPAPPEVSAHVMGADSGAVLEHGIAVLTGESEPGAEPGQFD